jgi:selenocysteine-specific elongation factor
VRYVIGTAGHVDHGKSSLVLALTGTDPDRLVEEKRRGMTIELGFASWTLPGGEPVGVVDVPGHRRFVRTMLAGAQGIDLVLLVVAADEGVMPQTREHLAICELLGAQRAVVALTKSDLVDRDMLELARAEVDEVIAASVMRGAPLVACSSVTRHGLDELAASVEQTLASATPRADRGRPRLFIDRSFSLPGFGTIVTGTLEGGALHSGEEVSALPGDRRGRIRGLQHHGRAVERAEPGTRTAVNLAGLSARELRRGMALVRPGVLAATAKIDARVRLLRSAPAPLRHRGEVLLYLGTAEIAAGVWLLDGAALEPGESGYAQLDMAQPVCAAPGDRFVLRRASPAAMLGGGVVLDIAPRRHRRRDQDLAAALGRRELGGTEALVVEELRKARLGAEPAALVSVCGAGTQEIEATLAGLGTRVRPLGTRRIAAERWTQLRDASVSLLEAFHAGEPLRAGMSREEWRSRLRLPAGVATDVAHALRSDGALTERDSQLALPGRGGDVSSAARAAANVVLAMLERRGLDPPPMPELRGAGLTPPLLRLLIDERRVVRIAPDVILSAGAYARALAVVEEALMQMGEATVAQLRDRLGTTRRVVVPLLESLDGARVTIRDGDLRRLRHRPPPMSPALP